MIDFSYFEELFKLGQGGMLDMVDGDTSPSQKRKTLIREPEKISVLEPNRLRNVGQ